MASKLPDEVQRRLREVLGTVNVGYAEAMYERYLSSPALVDEEWRRAFSNGAGPMEPATAGSAAQSGTTAADVTAAAANGQSARQDVTPSQAPAPPGATVLRGPAARLAVNMAASLAIPTATSFRDIDVAALEARRAELNAGLKPRKVSFTHLIGFAIIRAAASHQTMRHYFTQVDGQPHRVDPGAVNLGLAVDVERPDGSRFLIVPVIKRADAMDFAAFHATYEALVEKARTNKLSPDDLQGATITLTNPGTLGTTASVLRLMPGQGTIVATGTIRAVG